MVRGLKICAACAVGFVAVVFGGHESGRCDEGASAVQPGGTSEAGAWTSSPCWQWMESLVWFPTYTLSLPEPVDRVSDPEPPAIASSPASPLTVSSPGPPSRRSRPA